MVLGKVLLVAPVVRVVVVMVGMRQLVALELKQIPVEAQATAITVVLVTVVTTLVVVAVAQVLPVVLVIVQVVTLVTVVTVNILPHSKITEMAGTSLEVVPEVVLFIQPGSAQLVSVAVVTV